MLIQGVVLGYCTRDKKILSLAEINPIINKGDIFKAFHCPVFYSLTFLLGIFHLCRFSTTRLLRW